MPSLILNNPKFFPFFKDALGGIDGTHINCKPSAAERDASRNRKGGLSQNCLACCSFDRQFIYMASGWEGSAADGALFSSSRFTDLAIPHGKYYLADAGFGACDALLVPYRGVRYHLAEWGRANIRSILSSLMQLKVADFAFLICSPTNREELFNLRHAQGRNVIEQIFGIIKKRWDILNRPPQFSITIQARIPPACAALHNFIMEHNPCDADDVLVAQGGLETVVNGDGNNGMLAEAQVTRCEKQRAEALCNQIAQSMWNDYQDLLQRQEDE